MNDSWLIFNKDYVFNNGFNNFEMIVNDIVFVFNEICQQLNNDLYKYLDINEDDIEFKIIYLFEKIIFFQWKDNVKKKEKKRKK